MCSATVSFGSECASGVGKREGVTRGEGSFKQCCSTRIILKMYYLLNYAILPEDQDN